MISSAHRFELNTMFEWNIIIFYIVFLFSLDLQRMFDFISSTNHFALAMNIEYWIFDSESCWLRISNKSSKFVEIEKEP